MAERLGPIRFHELLNAFFGNIADAALECDAEIHKYVGDEAVIKSQIAEVQADKTMPAKDKKEALDDLNGALKNPGPAIQNKGNIDLVVKYYDQLAASLSNGQQ